MKTLALVVVMLSVCCSVTAQPAAQPAVTLGQAVSITGTIVAIDRADRELTVQGPQGNMVTVDVGESVRNFDQFRLGDQVRVNYFESVALSMGPRGQLPSATTSTRIGRGPGGSPYTVETTDIVAKVTAIDRSRRTVTLEGPMGNRFMVRVPQDMQRFDQLKVGDTVHARYTQAAAISIEKQ